MIDIVIINKTTEVQCTLRCSAVDSKVENFTLMQFRGVKGTEFEGLLPWKEGTVVSETEIWNWATDNQENYTVYRYDGNDEPVVLGDIEEEEEAEEENRG